MSDLKFDGGPSLSVVLITDTCETIRGVLRGLREQTVRERIEVVVVVPGGKANAVEAERTWGCTSTARNAANPQVRSDKRTHSRPSGPGDLLRSVRSRCVRSIHRRRPAPREFAPLRRL